VETSHLPYLFDEHSATVKRYLTVLAYAFGDPSYKADGDDDNGSLVVDDAAAAAPTVLIPARR